MNLCRSLSSAAALLLTSLLLPTAGLAAETLVYGDVLAVEAITSDTPVHCHEVTKPDRDAGLSALLIWDLERRPGALRQCRRAQAAAVQGYRVTYAYDGHEFVDILPERPGKRIPLTLELN